MCSGEEEAAWLRTEQEQNIWAKGIASKLANKASKLPSCPSAKVSKLPSFRHRGCPEDRTFHQLDRERLTSRKPNPKVAKKVLLDSLDTRINEHSTRATGWDIPSGGGLKGGAPSKEVRQRVMFYSLFCFQFDN